MGTGQPAKG